MSEISAVVKRVVSGKQVPSDIIQLEHYLHDGRSRPFTNRVLAAYLEYAEAVDWTIVNLFVRYPDDPMISATVILNASLRRENSFEFWKAVEEIAAGEEWDDEDDARIMAVLALPLSPSGCNENVRSILSACANDASPVLRDSAIIAAQRCLGIPEQEILSGDGTGDLRNRVGGKVSDWLNYP